MSRMSVAALACLFVFAGCSDPRANDADDGSPQDVGRADSGLNDSGPDDDADHEGDVSLPDAQAGEPDIAARPAFDYDKLVLVDEVDMAADPASHEFAESPGATSSVQTLLGKTCRVLSVKNDTPTAFTYRLGAGGRLQAGKAYVLVVEYPEDTSRSMIVRNSATEMNLGFSTGQAVGDALTPPYVHPNSESIDYPLSQKIERWEEFFHLHDRYSGVDYQRNANELRYRPQDGFHVSIAHFASDDAPVSAGAAVCRIALYEAPGIDAYAQPLNLPPAGLPQRHLFFREEMSDGVVDSSEQDKRGLDDPADWYEYKARLMRFLGMNTFSKDLLEFGHVQGWDTAAYPDGWFVISQYPNRWERIIHVVTRYGLNILPMYEYSGGTGDQGLGRKRRATPLYNDKDYTHIGWTEDLNTDVSDPDTLEDARQVLKATMTDLVAPRPAPAYGYDGRELQGWQTGWGYVDFGENWKNTRITEAWTRSRRWASNNAATPFSAVYWYDGSPDAFQESALNESMREETINFITQPLHGNNSSHWRADFRHNPAQAITPASRYLAMKLDSHHGATQEAMLVGWIEGGDVSQTGSSSLPVRLPVQGGAMSGSQLDLRVLFDEADTYRAEPAKMVGAWFRPRSSAMPMGFGPQTLARFAATLPDRTQVTREDLRNNPELLALYYTWWNGQRQALLSGLGEYAREEFGNDALVLFTADHTECGATHPTRAPGIVTDDTDTWAQHVDASRVMSLEEALRTNLQQEALRLPLGTWGNWEWQHAAPAADARNYRENARVLMTYSFNRLYTVSSAESFTDYRTPRGLAAIRHYCLNEHVIPDTEASPMLGYFVANIEPAGPYLMLAEARAVANGDPTHLGYLASNNFNRGFPAYARNFNANFLALPALKSERLADASSHPDVVVRSIATPAHGTWLAVVNTSLQPVSDVTIQLPRAGEVRYAPTGQTFATENQTLKLDLYPGQLVSLWILP